jgi:flavin-dependent dehydrogenase
VFGTARYTDEAGRLFVGEAAGLQDPEWGFGMWYAMESGSLAARSHLEGFDYAEAARRRFDPVRDATFFNRLLYECLPEAAIPRLFRRASRTRDMPRRLGRHWAPSRVKTKVADVYWPRFATARLKSP